MIAVINLNTGIDKRYEIAEIEKGKIMRARSVDNTAGGKGIHVANVVTRLGEAAIVTGFAGGKTGEFILEKLAEMGIEHQFIPTVGCNRECLAFITDDFVQTEILEPGPVIQADELEEFLNHFEEFIVNSSIVVASGSIPQNVPKTIYADLIGRTAKLDKKFLLDTSGECLLKGIEAKPFLIKPNKDELEILAGRLMTCEQEILEQINQLNRSGIECVVVSLGNQGSLVGYQGRNYRVQVPKVAAVNPVGSGDAFMGGFAVGLQRNYSIKKTLALASACGTANVLEKETGCVQKVQVDHLFEAITVVEL